MKIPIKILTYTLIIYILTSILAKVFLKIPFNSSQFSLFLISLILGNIINIIVEKKKSKRANHENNEESEHDS